MNKKLILITLGLMFCFVSKLNAGWIFYPEGSQSGKQSSQETQAPSEQGNIQEQVKLLEEDNKSTRKMLDELKDKYNSLSATYEQLKIDRDNLLVQTKRLTEENKKYSETQGTKEDFTVERNRLTSENDTLKQQNIALNGELEKLKTHFKNLAQERSRLEGELNETQETKVIRELKDKMGSEIAKLKDDVGSLKSENRDLSNKLKQSQKDSSVSDKEKTKFKNESEIMKKQLAELEEKYAKLKDENRYLTQEINEFPKRFADLARQNKRLIEDSADMHYNVGVFYVNNKEFKRAVTEFQKVLEIKPNHAFAYYNLGYIYAEHLIDRPKAIKNFKDYLMYAPDAQDADWVRKYIITWQTWYGEEPYK